jgi:hypothetical protein
MEFQKKNVNHIAGNIMTSIETENTISIIQFLELSISKK